MPHRPDDRQPGDDPSARSAYEVTAPFFDDFTAGYDYEAWVGEMVKLADAHGLHGTRGRALDVACGTGKSSLELRARGLTVTACDISPAMIDIAREKARSDASLGFEVADMRDLPRYGQFDLVTCFNDGVNYLLSAAELQRALVGMAANLSPDGVLIFDANTLLVYRGFFAEHFEVEAGERRILWDGRSGGEVEAGEVSEAKFEVRDGAGRSVASALHRQRHHPEDDVRHALAYSDLELVGLYGHDYDGIPRQPMSEREHTKAIYVAQLRTSTAD
jgi:SAM-dependent methyltransferase